MNSTIKTTVRNLETLIAKMDFVEKMEKLSAMQGVITSDPGPGYDEMMGALIITKSRAIRNN